jgi:hypothetical protein
MEHLVEPLLVKRKTQKYYPLQTLELAKLSKIIDMGELLQETPLVSNYLIEVTRTSDGSYSGKIIEIYPEYSMSNSLLSTHISLSGLTPECGVGLSEAQFVSLKKMIAEPH